MAAAWEATSTDGQRVFLKRVRAQAKFDASALNREAAIYQRLQQITAANAHLLSVREWVRDDEWVALVTEFADGGDLAASIAKNGPMSTTGAVSVMRDVLRALSTFHQNDIVHRDIKPGNVVWTRGSWKIADFGIAKNTKHVVTNYTFQSVGTQAYMAPEQKEGADAAPPMDVFAAGKLLCFLLTGNTDVDAVPYPRAAVVVRACTSSNPAERPTALALLTMLNTLTA
jgi:serine/threonine protein kinase